MDNKNGFNKKKAIVVILAALAVTAVLGTTIALCMNSGKKDGKNIATEITDVLTADEDAKLNEQIDAEIDKYLQDFSKQSSFAGIMTKEDKAALGSDILTELSKDMTDEQLTQMKEILVKLFSDDSTLTITGSAYFTDETKAYINQNIRAAVHDAISGYSADGGEHYTELQTTVERIVRESVGDSSVGYSLGAVDLDNIKQSVLASIGSVRGETGATGATGPAGRDGADGKDGIDGRDGKDGENGKDGTEGKKGEDGKNGVDGRDGRDGKDGINGTNGRDGKDGYTPVKGTDYFTEKEVDSIIATITGSMEKYVNGIAPVKGKDYFTDEEIKTISAVIKSDMTDLFNESIEKITKNYEVGISELDSKLTDEIHVNVTTLENTIGTLETNVNSRFEEIISAINVKLSEVVTAFNDSMTAFRTDMEGKFANLSERTDNKLSDIESETNEKIQSLADSTETALQEIVDNEASFELITNGDGTYTLKITDPKNQRNQEEAR